MTDREREARIRERTVLDREDVESVMGAAYQGGSPRWAWRQILAHDAAQRAEIERYREALEAYRIAVEESRAAGNEVPSLIEAVYADHVRRLQETGESRCPQCGETGVGAHTCRTQPKPSSD